MNQYYETVDAQNKITENVLRALKLGEHLWIATAAWKVVDPTNPQLILDKENLLMPPVIGCYICELSYSTREFHRRCGGKPLGGIPPVLPGMPQ
jgi:hypothetical protein